MATIVLNYRTHQLMTTKRSHGHNVDGGKCLNRRRSSIDEMYGLLSSSMVTRNGAWPMWPLIYKPINATISYFSDIPLYSVERSLAWPFIFNHIQLPPLTSLVTSITYATPTQAACDFFSTNVPSSFVGWLCVIR
jgi:hypothetical protein